MTIDDKDKKAIRRLFGNLYVHLRDEGKNSMKYTIKTVKGESYTIEVKIKKV